MNEGVSRVGVTGAGTATGVSGSTITTGAGVDSGLSGDGALGAGAEAIGSGSGGGRTLSATVPEEGRESDVTPSLSTLSLEDQVRV
jgi:hypothetical protein